MKKWEIENLLQNLAMSQGFYGRLLRDIYSLDEDDQQAFWDELETQNFGTDLDVVLFFEA